MKTEGVVAGRVAIVTGSTRGIGRAVAERLSAEGALVVAHGRDPARAARVAGELAGPATAVAGDIADPATAEALVAAATERFGRLDILVNNAGVARDGFLTRITDEMWHEVLGTNLSGPFFTTRAAVPAMKADGGTVLNLVSWAGLRGNVGQAAYAAAKAGLHGLTLALAKELAKFQIRVNALSPLAATDISAGMPAELQEKAVARAPLHRLGSLDEIAEAALFLVSDRAAYTTGQVLHVDGGLHLN